MRSVGRGLLVGCVVALLVSVGVASAANFSVASVIVVDAASPAGPPVDTVTVGDSVILRATFSNAPDPAQASFSVLKSAVADPIDVCAGSLTPITPPDPQVTGINDSTGNAETNATVFPDAGSYVIDVSSEFAGFQPDCQTQRTSLRVNKENTTTDVAVVQPVVTLPATPAVDVTVTGNAPTGKINVSVLDPTRGCNPVTGSRSNVPLDGTGDERTSRVDLPDLTAPGTYAIEASYGGDKNNNASATTKLCGTQDAVKVRVDPKPPTVTPPTDQPPTNTTPNGGTEAPTLELTFGAKALGAGKAGKPLALMPKGKPFKVAFDVKNVTSKDLQRTLRIALRGVKVSGNLPKTLKAVKGGLLWTGTIKANAPAEIPAVRLLAKRKSATVMVSEDGKAPEQSGTLSLIRETQRLTFDPVSPAVLTRGATKVTLTGTVNLAECKGRPAVQFSVTQRGKRLKPFLDPKRATLSQDGALCRYTWTRTFVPAIFGYQKLTFQVIRGTKSSRTRSIPVRG